MSYNLLLARSHLHKYIMMPFVGQVALYFSPYTLAHMPIVRHMSLYFYRGDGTVCTLLFVSILGTLNCSELKQNLIHNLRLKVLASPHSWLPFISNTLHSHGDTSSLPPQISWAQLFCQRQIHSQNPHSCQNSIS